MVKSESSGQQHDNLAKSKEKGRQKATEREGDVETDGENMKATVCKWERE